MNPLTIDAARRKLELGIERQEAIVRAQEARRALALRNRDDAEDKIKCAKREREYLSDCLHELRRTENTVRELP